MARSLGHLARLLREAVLTLGARGAALALAAAGRRLELAHRAPVAGVHALLGLEHALGAAVAFGLALLRLPLALGAIDALALAVHVLAGGARRGREALGALRVRLAAGAALGGLSIGAAHAVVLAVVHAPVVRSHPARDALREGFVQLERRGVAGRLSGSERQ